VPEKVTIDKSGANTATIERFNAENEADIEIRQIKCLNNIVEQDHRAIKRVTRPRLGYTSFRSAAATLVGVELMHMIQKGQLQMTGNRRHLVYQPSHRLESTPKPCLDHLRTIGGVSGDATRPDDIVFDIGVVTKGVSQGGYGHPVCGRPSNATSDAAAAAIVATLPQVTP
jgi:hypothetical protein